MKCDTPEQAARAVMGEIRDAQRAGHHDRWLPTQLDRLGRYDTTPSLPNPDQAFRDARGLQVQTSAGQWLWLADPAYVAALPTGKPW